MALAIVHTPCLSHVFRSLPTGCSQNSLLWPLSLLAVNSIFPFQPLPLLPRSIVDCITANTMLLCQILASVPRPHSYLGLSNFSILLCLEPCFIYPGVFDFWLSWCLRHILKHYSCAVHLWPLISAFLTSVSKYVQFSFLKKLSVLAIVFDIV